jgi:hypothetical protein
MRLKKKSQKQHAQKRAIQRYGVPIGPKTYNELCQKVQKQGPECVFLERQSNRVSMFAVILEGNWVPIIYDKQRHTIVTFLPQTALEPYRDQLNATVRTVNPG